MCIPKHMGEVLWQLHKLCSHAMLHIASQQTHNISHNKLDACYMRVEGVCSWQVGKLHSCNADACHADHLYIGRPRMSQDWRLIQLCRSHHAKANRNKGLA